VRGGMDVGGAASAVHELNVVEECCEMEQETGWCSSGGDTSL
jgi:hypothetical protein